MEFPEYFSNFIDNSFDLSDFVRGLKRRLNAATKELNSQGSINELEDLRFPAFRSEWGSGGCGEGENGGAAPDHSEYTGES